MNSLLHTPCQAATRFVIGLATFCFLILAQQAKAHELSPAVIDLDFPPGSVEAHLELNLEAMIAEIGPEHDDTDASPNAAEYESLRTLSAEALQSQFEAFAPNFIEGLSFEINGQPIEVDITKIEIPSVGDVDIARTTKLKLTAPRADNSETIAFAWAEQFGPIVVRTATTTEGEDYAAFLSGGEMSEQIAIVGQKARPAMVVFMEYIGIGFEHILPLGLDHILFVVGLFLLSTQLRPLVLQITAFTLAHTVTLALGMTGLVTVPGSIVEPMIAASIVFVAVENILRPTMSAWRPGLVFLFGLLHGLGFAGVLSEFGIPAGQFVPALIGFNIGVELGQLTVIAICLALFGYWFGGKPWYRARVIIPGSIIIALIGAYWFVERTLL